MESSACPACGEVNPEDAKFCGSCGTALAATCPRCGHRNPAGTNFCMECGAALAAAAVDLGSRDPAVQSPATLHPSELSEERKLITVLFADVAGYTSISEQLDPEETREMMQRAFDVMLEEIHRYEGTVSQLLGDGVLALFGAPIAHEDHAQRAIRAGLGIQEGLRGYQEELDARGIDFRVRVGLHSGLVVFGHMGTDLEFTFQAVGDTVNTASRVQGLARPGTVIVSENTHRLAQGFFDFEDLGEHEVKNKAEPLRVHEVLRPTGSRSRVEISAERGLSPFVGRSHELQVLMDRFEDARGGRGQVVFVSGEAGLGKSRLLHEFRLSLADADATWLAGRCISYGADISYTPVIDLVKGAAEIEEPDGEEETGTKLAAMMREVGADLENLPYLRSLLSLDPGDPKVAASEPAVRKTRLFDALRDVVLATAERHPAVLVIEDLHWIDQLSVELLSYLSESVPIHRLLLLLTHRPDWEPPFGDLPHYTRLELRPLSAEETERVAESALAGDGIPEALRTLIHRKAEGNPFFVEEVAKSLAETGVLRRSGSRLDLVRPIEEVEVPDTVQDVIMARIDRLPEEPRRALQTASVIGREFTSRLLDRTADLGPAGLTSMRELKSVQLIFERSLYPELVFMFKHALTHEVAYGSLLVQRRRELHGAVGDAIEELYADRLPELHEALAHHFERAERWEKAARYLTAAAEKAMQAAATGQVVTYVDRALAALGHLEEGANLVEAAHLWELRGQALELMNAWDDAVDSHRKGLEHQRSIGDRRAEGAALVHIAMTFAFAHRFEEAMRTAEDANAIAEETDDDDLRAGVLITRVTVLAVTGEVDAAYELLDEMERVALAVDSDFKAIALDIAGELRHWRGEERDAMERLDEALAFGRDHDSASVLIWVLWDRALSLINVGRYEQALASLREHQQICEQVGDRFLWCRSENTLGWLYYDICNLVPAISHNRAGIEESEKLGDPEIIRNAQLNLADCILATGDAHEALRILREVERSIAADTDPRDEWMKWRYSQHLYADLGAALVMLGEPEEALSYGRRCTEEAEATGAKRNVVKGKNVQAVALAALGRLDEASEEADAGLSEAERIGNPAQIRRSHAIRGDVLAAQDRAAEAVESYRSAFASAEAVADSLSDDGLRSTFLASEEISRIRERANR